MSDLLLEVGARRRFEVKATDRTGLAGLGRWEEVQPSQDNRRPQQKTSRAPEAVASRINSTAQVQMPAGCFEAFWRR